MIGIFSDHPIWPTGPHQGGQIQDAMLIKLGYKRGSCPVAGKWKGQMGVELAKQQEICDCRGHIFTETCPHRDILDQAVGLNVQTLLWADRSRTTKCVLCVYIIHACCSSKVKLTECVLKMWNFKGEDAEHIIITILLLLFTFTPSWICAHTANLCPVDYFFFLNHTL